MYTVNIAHECGCFKKSEYEASKSFDFQKDAYNYANVVTEFMNEEFCSAHLFFAQKTGYDNFVIGVSENPNAGSCSSGSCGPSEDWTLESTDSDNCNSGSCGCS